MRNKIITIIVLLLCTTAQAQNLELPSCVQPEKSDLIFPGERSRQDHFYEKLDSLIQKQEGNLNIWHIGGSHVQGDSFPLRLMERFQNIAGRGDRGFICHLHRRKMGGTDAHTRI